MRVEIEFGGPLVMLCVSFDADELVNLPLEQLRDLCEVIQALRERADIDPQKTG